MNLFSFLSLTPCTSSYLLLGPPLFPTNIFLSTTLSTRMPGISLRIQWPLTSQTHGCNYQREWLFFCYGLNSTPLRPHSWNQAHIAPFYFQLSTWLLAAGGPTLFMTKSLSLSLPHPVKNNPFLCFEKNLKFGPKTSTKHLKCCKKWWTWKKQKKTFHSNAHNDYGN
jgi:hypothetical protein